jgi:phosphotransferase system HPr-like phosphotransfer protein
MSLGATSGKELVFKLDGEDEAVAYDAIKTVCYEKLG